MGKSSKKSGKQSKKQLQKQIQATIKEANAQKTLLDKLPSTFLNIPLSLKSTTRVADTDEDGKDQYKNEDATTNDNDNNNTNDNNVATIQYIASPLSLSSNMLEQCLELFEINMGEMYKQSKWGLDMEAKRKELEHKDARFLVVLPSDTSIKSSELVPAEEDQHKSDNNTNPEQQVLGFAHFRYEPDDEDHPKIPTTYLYELQVHPTVQGHGLGKKLMTLIELISIKLQIKKILLTVFYMNKGAMSFYKKNKYDIDECSPSNFEGGEDCDYEILSKQLK